MIVIKNYVFFKMEGFFIPAKENQYTDIGLVKDQHVDFINHYMGLNSDITLEHRVLKHTPLIIPNDDWVCSDLHLGHTEILHFDNRDFPTIEDHDAIILLNLIHSVRPNDKLYVLGDMFWYKDMGLADSWLSQIPGNKFFIKGNHDYKETIKLYEKHGVYLGEQKMVKMSKDRVVLNHFPMRSWDCSHHGTHHLYGHHHGDIEHTPYGKSMDVCIKLNNYFPFNYRTQIKPVLDSRDVYYIPGDHHKNNQ